MPSVREFVLRPARLDPEAEERSLPLLVETVAPASQVMSGTVLFRIHSGVWVLRRGSGQWSRRRRHDFYLPAEVPWIYVPGH